MTSCPHGQTVRFDLTELMRPATADLVTMISTLYPLGLLGADESRSLLGLAASPPTALAPPGGPPTAGRHPARPRPARARSGPDRHERARSTNSACSSSPTSPPPGSI